MNNSGLKEGVSCELQMNKNRFIMGVKISFSGLFMIVIFTVNLHGQEENWISEKGAPITSVDLYEAEIQDNEKLLAQSRSDKPKDGPLTFAKAINSRIKSSNSGTWETLENGKLLWRQRIRSNGAHSLNLGFGEFYLPQSARMFMYDVNKTYVIGPIISEDNEEHGEWWSPILPFEEVVIEIQIDKSEREFLKTEVTSIQHDFVGFGNLLSGSCNVDVVCGAEDNFTLIDQYRDIINSVGMYSINGIDLCTGSLINNTRNDCTPYFLTAQHCGVTQSNAATVVIYWNYQNSTCRAPGSSASGSNGNGTQLEFNSGTQLVAEHDRTDFALLELDDIVGASTRPYFAGWDRTTIPQDTLLSIHHPNTEEKRISFDFDISEPFVLGVFIRITNWDIGTTESGSSGSPLFTTSGQVIGQLNGGLASCSNSNNSIETDDYDDYGMLALSWDGGGTPETRLKDWLDPLGQDVTQLEGRGCSDLVSVTPSELSFCTQESSRDTIELILVSGFDNGASIMVDSVTPGLVATLLSSEISSGSPSADVEIEVLESFNGMEAVVSLLIGDGVSSTSNSIPIKISNSVSGIPILESPSNQAQGVSYELELTWSGNADGYNIEISPDSNFVNEVIIVDNISSSSYLIRSLISMTKYFWRVQGSNSCGLGAFSDSFEFITGDIECAQQSAAGLPITISTDVDTLYSTILVESPGLIIDINVSSIVGRHTYVSDLTLLLTSPKGTEVRLISNACEDADNFSISFDDASELINRPCPLSSIDALRPEVPLSSFNGEEGSGEWTLTVIDDVFLDGGFLDAWSIEVCQVETPLEVDPDTITYCEVVNNSIQLNGNLQEIYGDSVMLSISNIDGDLLRATYSANPVTGSGPRVFTVTIEDIEQLVADESIIITADDGSLSFTESVFIESLSLSGPLQLHPSNGSTGIERKTEFSWESIEGGIDYKILVALDSNLNQVVFDSTVIGDSLVLPFQLLKETNYFWQITARNECVSTVSEIFRFQTDIIDPTVDPALRSLVLFPNPTSDYITIQGGDRLKKAAKLEIINAQGQILQSGELYKNETQIEFQKYEAGAYFIRFTTAEGILTRSVIKL